MAATPAFETSACQQALNDLHRIEEIRRTERALASSAGGAGAPVERARRDAAAHCLGTAATVQHPPPARVWPPVSVEAIGAAPVPVQPSRRATPAPPAAVAGSRPPTTVTQCDSAGCWTSDGSYLLRVGPELVGPAAMCGVLAGLLHCR